MKQNDFTQPLPKVSVIIPARNAEDTLPATLNAVLAQDYGGPIEVIVADGSDTPDTGHILRQHYPTVQVVPNPEQITPTGLNYALQAATGEVIVRCDTHAVLPPHYLKSNTPFTNALSSSSPHGSTHLPIPGLNNSLNVTVPATVPQK